MDEEIDENIQVAYDLANWAMEEAQAANDLLVMLLQVVTETQPETARRFRAKVQAVLDAQDVARSSTFDNTARRICGLVDGKEPYFDSFMKAKDGEEQPKRRERPKLRIVKIEDGKDS